MADPAHPTTKGLAWFAGMGLGGTGGGIGLATFNLANPLAWTDLTATNPLLAKGANGTWDDGYIRLDSVIYDEIADVFLIYYTGNDGGVDRCGLAISNKYIDAAGANGVPSAVTLTKYVSNPILSPGGSTPNGVSTFISQMAVLRVSATEWYGYPSYRVGAGTSLPGMLLATSADGRSWTVGTSHILAVGAGSELDNADVEWKSVKRIGGCVLMLYEGYDGINWRAFAASATSPSGVFRKSRLNAVYPHASRPGDGAELHIATPAIYRNDYGTWLFGQRSGSVDYSSGTWDLFGIAMSEGPEIFISV